MADDNDQDNDEQQAAGGALAGKKKLILLVVAGLLVVAASIGGTLWLLGVFDGDGEPAPETAAGEQPAEQAAGEPAGDKPRPAMYFPIKPAFVVNFPSKGRQRYMQVDVTVMTRDPDVFNALQQHLPLIKNRLVMLMSGEVYEELQTHEGKELLRQKATEALQEVMQEELGKPGVEQVLFTNFVMQ